MIASFKAAVILVEERNSVSVVCVGLTRAIPPSLAGRARRSPFCVVWWWSTCKCRSQFSSDDHFKGQEVEANAGHGASEIGPLAGHSMSKCCMSSMRLGACNGCQLL